MMDSRRDRSDHRRHSQAELTIMLASPSDVLKERRVFFQVVARVNTTLANLGKQIWLKPVAWEDVFPDAGAPQRVINEQLQLPIGEYDIFVAVFWKRFGIPTGERRPDDGRPYLSGTEQLLKEYLMQVVQPIEENDLQARGTLSVQVASAAEPKQDRLNKAHLTRNPLETYVAKFDRDLRYCFHPSENITHRNWRRSHNIGSSLQALAVAKQPCAEWWKKRSVALRKKPLRRFF